jgi:hypothetical protein
MSADLAAEITEYLTGERQATEPNELCRLIYLEAAHNTQWTKATFEQWEEALEQAIKRGLIERKGNKVAVAVQAPKPTETQLGLFD